MTRPHLLNALLVTTALVSVPAALARAQTLPSGGQVASGQASIATTAPGRMTIQQSSQTAVVNWQSFSIGQGGRVDIRQPNADAAMLNRVTGTTPSTIAGQLNANGRVYLVNPNGIAIGPTGEVRAQGFVASTLDIRDDDFRAGRRNFQGNGASAAVSNAGLVEVGRGGYAALLGGQVSNAGTISAAAGRISLGAGERATLDLSGDGFLQVALPSASTGSEALVTNSGTLSAVGGRVELSAATARDAARRAVNMSGVVVAQGVTTQGGAIVLSGGEGGAVEITGRLDASSATARGGQVTVTGQSIALQGARVEASGATGGGRVRVGGDREGRGSLQRAERVRADATTTIRADATQRGTGGDVVVWSDNRTDFAGTISARGGAEGGDGGQAEVSSRGVLNYTGTTDLRAPAGEWGTLLLDPYNITISTGATSGAASTTTSFTANADDSVINATDLVTALATANVTVSTGSAGTQDGNITVSAALSWTGASTLTLQAAGAINLNEAITASAGGLALQAGGTIGATGAITVGRFELLSGNWVQTAPTLPGLSASDFRLTGGTFLRATGGDGTTTTTPWLLTDIFGVQGMATQLGAHFRLANDIAAAGTAGWNSGAGFRPIGADGARFTGSLDGAGHVISGLTISRPTQDRVGLFGATGTGSTISNIGLVGGSVTGGERVGGLVGHNLGAITQAYVTGAVTGAGDSVGGLVGHNEQGTIAQSHATGAVSGPTSNRVGGLVGLNSSGSTIEQAYATGTVSGRNNVGGLVGWNSGTIRQAYATGSATGNFDVGGLVGRNIFGTINETYATGAVRGADGLGGLIGWKEGLGGVTASFWDTQTTLQPNADGVLMISSRSEATGLGGAGQPDPRSAASYTGWNFATDWFQAGDMRPIGRWEAAPEVGGVRVIRNLNQLQLMAINLGASYRLGTDINAAPTNATAASPGIWGAGGFVPIGAFNGSLDGAGRVITGLTINRPTQDQVGLFGGAGTSASIRNIGLQGGSVTGRDYVGALVGYNLGTITQAHATASVTGRSAVGGLVGVNTGTITQAYAIGTVTGSGSSVGGLVGWNQSGAIITQAYATGTVSGGFSIGGLVGWNQPSAIITQAYATGAVTGRDDVGALVGFNAGTITQAYATGAVTGSGISAGGLVGFNAGAGTITQAYASGAVTGAAYVGGLIGHNFGTIRDAYATGTVAGRDDVGGLVGLNQNTGTITRAYASGAVTGQLFVGGLVGFNSNGTITASFWDSVSTGRSAAVGNVPGTVSGATPLGGTNQPSARAAASYTDWDFAANWFQAGDMRPIGRWEAAPEVSGVRVIRNLNQLQLMAINLGASYRLGTDINAAPTDASAASSGIWGAGGFVPIGTNTARFTGSLDGAGHVITGLTISRPTLSSVGLFGITGSGASIRNIGLQGGSVTGNHQVGALVGQNNGTITQAYATGTVSGMLTFVGGLVGANAGTITQSSATGTVSGLDNDVGGLVGWNEGVITQAYATGAVTGRDFVGGLAGSNYGRITQAYASGAVTGRNDLGGLVGDNSSTFADRITASFWDSVSTGRSAAVGGGSGSGATPLGGTGEPSARAVASYSGWNFTEHWFQAGDMRPIGRWEAAQPGAEGVRVIRNLNQLQLMTANLGANYRLGNDINAAPTNATAASSGIWGAGGFVPVGTNAVRFTGRLDGAGHVITGLTINRPGQNYVGLFGATGTSASISNIGLQGGAVTGQEAVGALVGQNDGAITQAYATGTVSGEFSIGGLVGINDGTITQAYATGAVSSQFPIGGQVGGLVGWNRNGTITQAYAAGTVTGQDDVGGLVGFNSNGTITASFFDTVTTRPSGANEALPGVGNGSSSGVTGLTTDQLQDLASFRTTYAGWDFDTVWVPPHQSGQSGNPSTAFYPELYSLSNVAVAFVPNASRQYGDANPSLTATYRGLRTGDRISTLATIGSTATTTTGIGSYGLTASGMLVTSPAGRTYRTVHVPGTLTITPRVVTLAGSRQYDGTTSVQASVLSMSNVVPNETLSLAGEGSVTNRDASSTAQTVTVAGLTLSGAGGTQASNYTLADSSSTVTITPRVVTLAGSRQYDGTTSVQASVLSVSNLASTNDTLSLTGLGSVGSANASTTTQSLTLSGLTLGGAAASNYTLTNGSGTVTITRRQITLTADAQSRFFGEANPPLTYRLGTVGLVSGDTLAGGLATDAKQASTVGVYPINLGTIGNTNYSITFIGNTLTIVSRPATRDPNAALTFAPPSPAGDPQRVARDQLTGGLETNPTATRGFRTVLLAGADEPNLEEQLRLGTILCLGGTNAICPITLPQPR